MKLINENHINGKTLSIIGKVFLSIIVFIFIILLWTDYVDSEDIRLTIITSQNRIDSIAKYLSEENDLEAVEKAQNFCSEYQKIENAYSENNKQLEKDLKTLSKLGDEKDKLIAKNKKQDVIEKKQKEIDTLQKTMDDKNNQNKEYETFLEKNKKEYKHQTKILETIGEESVSIFGNYLDFSFYDNNKSDIEKRYNEYLTGTVKPFEEPEPVSKISYIFLTFIILLVSYILIFLIPSLRRNKKIKEISIMLYKTGDVNAAEKAMDFVEFYEERKEKIDSLSSKKLKIHNKKKVLEIEAKIKVLQSEINGTEQQYYTSKAIFEQFSDKQLSLYFDYKNKVIASYKKLIEEGKLKEIQLDNARKEKMQKEIEAQQKSIEQRDMEDEIADKKELLTRAIKELKDKINILQNEVDKSGELQRDFLQNITNNLEKIENNKSSLDENDRKLLNRNKMILYDCFERAKNTDDLKVNVTIIKEIFEGL